MPFLFSGRHSTDTAGELILLGLFRTLVAVTGVAIKRVQRSMRVSGALSALQDTTA
ncbi:MAG: hypothetical protein ACLP0J_15100 [Solirubrobacteraceae bacterium]